MSASTKVGILGAGQLGRMFNLEASNWGLEPHFLDKSPDFPAGKISHKFHQGNFNDFDDVLAFGKKMDVISIEIEHVNIDALRELEKEGKIVIPQVHALEIIQDKGLQKQFYAKHHIPTSPFLLLNNKKEIEQAIINKVISFPFVQKSRSGGYDGKGVVVINAKDDLSNLLEGPSVIEQCINIQKEIAVLICRDQNKNIATYDPVEMVFDPKANLVDYLLSPAEISIEQKSTCKALSVQIAESLDIIGLLAVELFLDTDGQIYVNEVAPRSHNSGHHTMNSCLSSQFEQHMRILYNMPLGSTKQVHLAAMVNILGGSKGIGKPVYNGIESIAAIEGIYPHIYGKEITKPYRKMGHVNIIGDTKEDLLEKIEIVKTTLNVDTNE